MEQTVDSAPFRWRDLGKAKRKLSRHANKRSPIIGLAVRTETIRYTDYGSAAVRYTGAVLVYRYFRYICKGSNSHCSSVKVTATAEVEFELTL